MLNTLKSQMSARIAWGLLGLFFMAATGCEKPQVSTYHVAKHEYAVTRPAGLEEWEVPEGWLGRMSASPTVATFLVFNDATEGNATHPAGGSATVMIVKMAGSAGELQPNMTRWAKQIGLDTPEGDAYTKALSVCEVNGTTGHRVRFENPKNGQALRVDWVEAEGFSWFFKISGDATTVAKTDTAMDAFTSSIRFTKIDRKVANPLTGIDSWELQPGWVAAGASQFVDYSFQIPGEPTDLRLTVSRAGGGLAAQFNRWAGRLKLELPEDPIKEWVTPLEVGGRASHLVDMHNAEEGLRMRLVMVPGGEGMEDWFFTLRGHDVSVNQAADPFDAFVQSIKFAENGEGN